MDSLSPHAHQRQCSACKNFFPATPEFFCRDKRVKSGLQARCKRCKSEYNADHREQNKQSHAKWLKEHAEEQKQYNTRHYAEHREEKIQAHAKWRDEHRDETRRYTREYRAIHYEQRLQAERRYHAEHREARNENRRQYRQTERGRMLHRISESRRNALKREIGGTLTLEQIQAKLKAQHHKCYYCFTKFEKKNGRYIFHLEHTIPLSRTDYAPRNDINFVVLACPSCNMKKNDRLPHEFWEGGRLL